MRKRTKEMLEELFHASNEQRLCITTTDERTRRELCRLTEGGILVSPWRGMYADAAAWNNLGPIEQERRIIRTLSKKHPSWVFCQHTAAVMHGLEVAHADLLPLHVAVGPRRTTRSTSKILRHPMAEKETIRIDEVPVTGLLPTGFDCLVDLDFKRGLAIADSLLKAGNVKRADLVGYITSRTDVPGWSCALDAAAYASPLAANGGESVARATIIEQGFMLPKLQVEIPNVIDRSGSFYAGFLWELPDGTRVAGELEGLEKYYDPEMTGGKSVARVLSDERRRESRLGAAGVKVLRFSYDDVLNVRVFNRLLEAYGIPRGPARPRGHIR